MSTLTKWVKPYRLLSEEGVADLIAEALKRVQIYRPYRQDAIYITEAVQPCMRKVYFDRLHPQPPSVATVVGEYLHQLIEEAFGSLRELGVKTEVGVGLDLSDFKLVGRVDVVLEDNEGNVLDVVEIKTVGRVPEEPYDTHVAQLQAYIELLEAPKGTLVYVDRNRGHARIFDVEPDRRALELAITNAQVLWQALQDYVPPPPHRGAWCVFCPRRKRCWAAGLRHQ